MTIDKKLTLYSDSTLIGYLLPSDGLKDAKVTTELGGNSQLQFDLPCTSEKWDLLSDPLLRVRVDGKEFCPLNPIDTERADTFVERVTLTEIQSLMGREYPTVGNPLLAVTILASDPGEGGYDSGSASSCIYRLLNSVGSNWSVGTVDVSGAHDLETEKLTLIENLEKVQKLWGGWLVFDSTNKTVSLRDDTLWQDDTGFQIRYRKNEKSVKRTRDWTSVVTRLIPLGEKDLTIAPVNDGSIYLDNFSFTSEVRSGIWKREDIDDPTELKEAAIDYLAKVCRPRVRNPANSTT